MFSATGDGDAIALDDTTGKLLWKFPTDGRPYANPMSYLSEGTQQIAICIGHAVYAFGL